MGRANILICPSCDYRRYLTEAESCISGALVVACLKCGTAMRCTPKNKPAVPRKRQTFPEPCDHESVEDWVIA